MPRQLYNTEPEIINFVSNKASNLPVLEFATGNEGKLKEFRRILTGFQITGKDLKIDEIQSLDPYKVAEKKAIAAWEANNYNPIFVEDTSLSIKGLGDRPGTFINDFASEVEMRRMIAEVWLKDKDRTALARVVIAVYDGKVAHIWEGAVQGKISETLKGANGFGWDDMFIPKGDERTFAEMSSEEKDKYSMRRKALEKLRGNPVILNYPIYKIPEPYEQELKRVRISKLKDEKAIKFAYSLECLGPAWPSEFFQYSRYDPIYREDHLFYSRFNRNLNSSSLGLLLTDIDRAHIKLHKNGDPIIWQIGHERRHLALAQRADFFIENHNEEVYKSLAELTFNGNTHRSNKKIPAVEEALGLQRKGEPYNTLALKELGYKKISSSKNVSRTDIASKGLFNKIGKYNRSIFGIGSMPPVSGWRDVLVTAAVGHMPVFTSRNSLQAIDVRNQARLISDAYKVIDNIEFARQQADLIKKNIGAAVGGGNIKEEIEKAELLYKVGVRMFRIYTINGDPRVVEMAKAFREKFGNEIELFVGQIADKNQALELIADDIKADGLVFGHGGGRQCTSATNGMAVTTLEEIYSITTDNRFNKTTILAEGGIGTNVGAMFLLGVDGILYNKQLTGSTIEQGDIFFEHRNGELCQPYHGSASAATMLIESSNPDLLEKRMHASGRAAKVEGKSGYMFFKQRANSMVFYINMFKHFAARTLADLGVENFVELRHFLKESEDSLIRIVSTEAKQTGEAYRDSK